MEAKVSQSLQLSRWTCSKKTVMMPSHSLGFSPRVREKQRLRGPISSHFHPKKTVTWHRPVELKVSCTQMFPASVLESECFPSTCEEDSRLKNKSEENEAELDGKCIYLIGMMGSGKTTVGRVLSEVLHYSFFDSDKLIGQAVGRTAVADIFKLYGESFFRNNETEVLRKLSSMQRLVVLTGGGIVIRPINWQILARLSTLWEERSEAYINNANARVSLENIAAKMGYGDVCSIPPNEIAFEALLQIEAFLKK